MRTKAVHVSDESEVQVRARYHGIIPAGKDPKNQVQP